MTNPLPRRRFLFGASAVAAFAALATRYQRQEIRDVTYQGGKSPVPLASSVRTGNYTLTAADMGVEQVYSSSNPGTFTIPNDSTANIAAGLSSPLHQYGTGLLTIAPASGVTLISRDGARNFAGQYAIGEVRKIGNNAWVLYGDITT